MTPSLLPTLIAAVQLPVEVTPDVPPIDVFKEIGVVLGVLGCLAVVITYFSYRLHMRRVNHVDLLRRQGTGLRHSRSTDAPPGDPGVHRKRRRRRRANPSLAEGRGLPPKRTPPSEPLSRSG